MEEDIRRRGKIYCVENSPPRQPRFSGPSVDEAFWRRYNEEAWQRRKEEIGWLERKTAIWDIWYHDPWDHQYENTECELCLPLTEIERAYCRLYEDYDDESCLPPLTERREILDRSTAGDLPFWTCILQLGDESDEE